MDEKKIANDKIAREERRKFLKTAGTVASRIRAFAAAAFMFGLFQAIPHANATVLEIVDNIAGTFLDISGTGTALNLADDGEVDITTTVSNLVFGAGTVRVGANGGVRFDGTGLNLGFNNNAIPSTNAFSGDQTLLAFWDDIDISRGTAGNIFHQEISGTLFIQWEDADFFGGLLDTSTFQIQVFGSGSPALAQFLYTDIEGSRANGGGSATIGYQDGSAGFNDVQFSFNSAGAVSNGTVLSLVVTDIPEPGTLALFAIGLVGLGFMTRRRRKAA